MTRARLEPGMRTASQPQTHRRDVDGVLWEWDVPRLIALAADLDVERVPLAEFESELDHVYWFGGSIEPTVRAVVDHARRIDDAELQWPVIVSETGAVMDGMHRVARALRDGLDHIDVVRFSTDPEPDRTVPDA